MNLATITFLPKQHCLWMCPRAFKWSASETGSQSPCGCLVKYLTAQLNSTVECLQEARIIHAIPARG